MDKEERKTRTSKLRRNEILVWLGIIFVMIFLVCFSILKYEHSFEYHTIRIPDVDGLIVGSPVHLMGVPIGFVTKTKMLNEDEILVRFRISNRDIHILKGTIATVEFNGLGGSKSLELYPPDSYKSVYPNLVVPNNDYFIVERPKRLRDAWSLLYQMYQKLVAILCTVSNFGHKLQTIDTDVIIQNKNNTTHFIKYADSWIDNSSMNMYKYRKIIDTYKRLNKNESR